MPITNPDSFGIIGMGAWGTALAMVAARSGRRVSIWGRNPDIATSLSDGEGNPAYLNGISVPALEASTDPAILERADVILAVAPAQHMRAALNQASQFISPGTPVLLCAKGIERQSLKLMTTVLEEALPDALPAVLSGPSFAHDVARGLPTAVTLACADEEVGSTLVQAIGQPMFRPYWSPDLIGAEVGGAVKNVLAIACGIVEGLELGKSAHAALLSRGFAEMRRLAVALGAEDRTLSGLSGLGDLVLTCSSSQSRNMSFGIALGKGEKASDVLSRRSSVTEGAATAPSLALLASKLGVEMPICEAIDKILRSETTVDQAITRLLDRPFKEES